MENRMKNKTKTSIGLAIILASTQSMSAELININQYPLDSKIILNNNNNLDNKLLIQSILDQQVALKGDNLNILDLNSYLNSLTIEELLKIKENSSIPCMEN